MIKEEVQSLLHYFQSDPGKYLQTMFDLQMMLSFSLRSGKCTPCLSSEFEEVGAAVHWRFPSVFPLKDVYMS